MGRSRRLILALTLPLFAAAQVTRKDSIVVTGTAEPVPLEEEDRSVTVQPVQPSLARTLADFLRLDPSLDVSARAPDLMQTDVSIRGAAFGQTLVLLNGLRFNNAQSGHHNMDIPLPLDIVSEVQVLRGSGSTLYGSDALGGVVNIITRPPEATEISLRGALGNFGANQQRLSLAGALGGVAQRLAVSRDFSSGFQPNRDYRNLSAGSTTQFRSGLGVSDIVLGYSDRPFGADQFYGNYPSWENTKSWFASIEQDLGTDTRASFAYRRHSDLFVLYRDRPAVYANHHSDESWQGSLRRSERLGINTSLHYGGEGFSDSIESSNLGRHRRGRGAVYASLDFRALRRFSFTLGGREEVYRSYSGQFSPTASVGMWVNSRWKLRGSVSRAFRIPTYTELYYQDPANIGYPDLKPEVAWSYEGGADWNGGSKISASATVFRRTGSNGIDYVRASTADRWQAVNLQRLRFTGVEARVVVRPSRWQQVDLGYTFLNGAQEALAGLMSKYVFN